MGLVHPTRMIGNILFRKTIQFLKIVNDDKKLKNKIPWDAPVENFDEDHNFKDKWVDYFKMLSCLQETVFPRSYKPADANPDEEPSLISFDDGNEDAFGAVLYAHWVLMDVK